MRLQAQRTTAGLALLFFVLPLTAGDWPQYRGPGGTGVVETENLPTQLGPDKNVVWKTAVPGGASSPALSEDRIFLTAVEDDKLFVMSLDRADGRILWRREVPRPRQEIFNKTHGPASPSPVTDGKNVYSFFGDFGLISFGPDGEERWRLPLGPFQNINGHGSSPILADGMVILVVDHNINSYLMAVDKDSGKPVWKADRSEVTRGYGTAGVFRPSDGPEQLVIPGAYRVISYDLKTGKKLWWVRQMAWQLKCVPVFDGDTVYINGWETGGDPAQRKETESWQEVLAKHDKDGDGLLSQEEVPDERLKNERAWIEHDLDGDGLLGERDWEFYAARRAPINNMVAIRPAGRTGDLTNTDAVLWRYARSLPNTPSPLLYKGILYLIKDGGILQSLDPKIGEPYKLARIGPESIEKFWASPVAGDGKIYLVDQSCAVSVIKPGEQWEVLAVNQLVGYCLATPAIADGRLYVRTDTTLYAFGSR